MFKKHVKKSRNSVHVKEVAFFINCKTVSSSFIENTAIHQSLVILKCDLAKHFNLFHSFCFSLCVGHRPSDA